MHNAWTHKLQLSGPTVYSIDISYTLDSASVYQKAKPKISTVSPHNNGRRPYWSFPLIKKMLQKHYTFLHLCIKYFLAAKKRTYTVTTLSISAIQNTQIIMLRVNSVGTTSACDLASIFVCPQCGMHHLVYMRYLWSTPYTVA